MEKVSGVSFFDLEHDRIVVQTMLEAGVHAATTPRWGKIWTLQHGDATPTNVLWNGNTFVFIDLDNINYYPPLLDVFHYLCNYDLQDILKLLKENDELVKKIAERCGIDITGNYLDVLFRNYVRYYDKMGICFEDFRFLKPENTAAFPRTRELLCSMQQEKRL